MCIDITKVVHVSISNTDLNIFGANLTPEHEFDKLLFLELIKHLQNSIGKFYICFQQKIFSY